MEYHQIIADLKKKIYHPVYFLTGEEPYFIDAVSDYIEKNVLDETEKEFNQTVLYGRDVDIATVISAAKRFPMMSNLQVVIIKEAQNIKGLIGREKEEDKEDEKGKSPFLAYLENPQRSTILVFCYKYKSIDKRTALAKSIIKSTVFMDAKKLYDNKLPDWISGYLKEKNYTIDARAAVLLDEYLGADLSKISNELEKLMINLPPKSQITAEHIQNNIGISKDFNTFELQNALGKKDVFKANRIINYFEANPKEHPIVLTLSTLYVFFTKLLAYHFVPDKSKGIAAAIGVNPFFVGDYEKAAKNYNVEKLKHIFADLRDTDLKSKGIGTTSATHSDILKELVFKILH